jgi:hypothetical protein
MCGGHSAYGTHAAHLLSTAMVQSLAMLRHPWVFSMLQGVGCGTQCHGINSSMRFCGQPLMRRVSKSVK